MRFPVLTICFGAFIGYLGQLMLPAFAQEKSVKPGINKQFEAPKVTEFVERFEKEGREVYDQREKIIGACEIKQGEIVADVGAGTGLFTRMFSQKVGETGKVIAVDIAEEFVEHIKEDAAKAGVKNIEGFVCKPDSVDLEPASVDVVFVCDTYHHFEFPMKTLHSIQRILKPDGRLVLVEFERVEGKSSDWIMGHVRAGREVFQKEIEDAGFAPVSELKDTFKESYLIVFKKKTTSVDEGKK